MADDPDEQSPDERYSEVFHPHRNSIPTRAGIPICGKFQIIGHYEKNCPFDHKAINAESETCTKMNLSVTKCRNGIFRGGGRRGNFHSQALYSAQAQKIYNLRQQHHSSYHPGHINKKFLLQLHPKIHKLKQQTPPSLGDL